MLYYKCKEYYFNNSDLSKKVKTFNGFHLQNKRIDDHY